MYIDDIADALDFFSLFVRISWPNSSSNAMTNSTVSRESAPNPDELGIGVTWSALTQVVPRYLFYSLLNCFFQPMGYSVSVFCSVCLSHVPESVKP